MTGPTARKFTVGQVMTVLAGSSERTFCSWGEVLDVLGWLLQDVPLADEVDSAIEACRPAVAAQHPALVAYTAPPPRASDTYVLEWLGSIELDHGREYELDPMADEPEEVEA